MQLKLYKLDALTHPVCILAEGHHSLGRGTDLDCSDKRVSRNHVMIDIEEDKATFKLLHHTNPCYWKQANSTHISLLTVNISVNVNDGDMFGFFPDTNWYQIEFSPTISNNEDTAIVDGNTVVEAVPQVNNEGVPSISNQDNPELTRENPESGKKDAEIVTIKLEVEENVEGSDVVQTREMEHTPNIPEVSIKKECDTTTSDVSPSGSGTATNSSATTGTRQYRDRCWYGSGCYRRCQKHKAKYSHEGDNDYDTDPSDDRPLCPYGRNCYRRNGTHRRDFKHSSKATGKRVADDDAGDPASVDPANILPTKRVKKERKPENKDAESESEESPFATDEDEDYNCSDEDD